MKMNSAVASWSIVLLVAVFGLVALAPPSFAQDEIIDSAMYADPKVPLADLVKVFPTRLTVLWLQALERPDNDLKCQAAAAIGLARRRGMPGVESTAPALLRTLDQPNQHPSVRLAVAQALIALDAREAAPQLFAHARSRRHRHARSGRARVGPLGLCAHSRASGSSGSTSPNLRGVACSWQFRDWGRSRKRRPRLGCEPSRLDAKADSISRLEAARALAVLAPKGLEPDAQHLAGEQTKSAVLPQLIAATILKNHRSEASAKILQTLAVDAEPAAAAVALEGLLSADPRLVAPLMSRVLASRDAVVRMRGVEAFRRNPQNDQVASIAKLMDDPNTLVRVNARKALGEAAVQAGLGDAIRAQAMTLLAGTNWRSLEQAALLLAVLDHKAAAPRLVELLQFNRPEVFVAAAWGLRKLAVPATLPGQLKEVELRLNGSRRPAQTTHTI